MKLTTECEREEDGRWLAKVRELPGVLVYGQSPQEVLSKVKALALHVLADRLERSESAADLADIRFAEAGASGERQES